MQIILLLFVVAMLGGWVDVIAGGGGLLTIPALILVGIPPAAPRWQPINYKPVSER